MFQLTSFCLTSLFTSGPINVNAKFCPGLLSYSGKIAAIRQNNLLSSISILEISVEAHHQLLCQHHSIARPIANGRPYRSRSRAKRDRRKSSKTDKFTSLCTTQRSVMDQVISCIMWGAQKFRVDITRKKKSKCDLWSWGAWLNWPIKMKTDRFGLTLSQICETHLMMVQISLSIQPIVL
jgi:hypothetical protein